MDQNYQPYQNEQQPYQQAPVVKNAAYYRARARQILRPCYWYAVLAFLLAALLGGISSGGVSFNFSDTTADSNGVKVNISAEELLEAVRAGDVSALLGEISPFVVIILGAVAIGMVFSILFSIFVGSPMKLGYQRYNLNMVDGNGKDLGVLFGYFKRGYGKSIALNLLYGAIMLVTSLPMLAVMLLWFMPAVFDAAVAGGDMTGGMIASLLLSVFVFLAVTVATVVVQILIEYRYAFCFMILAEYPEMRATDALRNSASLMRGNKWRLFCLQISFIGWILLAACCTCGIGIVFLSPYMYAAQAAFYDDIANRAAARETEFPSLNPDDYVVD